MAIYLNSYNPIIVTGFGRLAVEKYKLKPFIDGSCRREPDFENPYPSITATCRGENFAPKLQINDIIIYMTVYKKYQGSKNKQYRLTAILEVINRFEEHRFAYEHYQKNNLPIPANCIVEENPPGPYEQTWGIRPNTDKQNRTLLTLPLEAKQKRFQKYLDAWDATYESRIKDYPTFLKSKPLFIELFNPPVFSIEFLNRIFGKRPGTENPGTISQQQFNNFISGLKIELQSDI